MTALPLCQEGALQQARAAALTCWISPCMWPAVLRRRCCRQPMQAHGMPHSLARQHQKDLAYVRHAHAPNIIVVSIACKHVALQHGNHLLAEALPTALCAATCIIVPALSHACQENTPGMCAGISSFPPSRRLWSTPCGATAWCRCLRVETSIRPLMDTQLGHCARPGRGGPHAVPARRSHVSTSHPAPRSAYECVTASHSKSPSALLCAGGTQSRRTRCWTEALAMRW